MIKQHLVELNADVLGLAELDTLINEIDLYAKANEIGKKAHKDVVDFLTKEMGYDSYILEKDSGLFASAIFYKRDKFECLEKGRLNLDFRMLNPELATTVEHDTEVGDFALMYMRLAPKNPDTNKADLKQ